MKNNGSLDGLVETRENVCISFSEWGEGRTTIFVHGTASAANRWQNVLEQFGETRRVVQYDRRGRGQSGDSDSYSLDAEVSDLTALINHLVTDEPVDVIAHSFGALVSLAALTDHASLFRRLVLYEAPLAIPGVCSFIDMEEVNELDKVLEQKGNAAATEFFLREFPRVAERDIAALKQSATWQRRIATAHTLARELEAAHNFIPDLDKLGECTTPCLFILGGESPQPFALSANKLNECMPVSSLKILEGEGHRAMDTVPDLLFEIIRDYLDN